LPTVATSEPEEGFKVTDRRRRAADEAPGPTGRPMPSATPHMEDSPRRHHAQPEPEADEPSLVGLFVMLGSSAVVALGEAEDPLSGQRHVDLDQAAEAIDLLILLRRKTEGHRSPEETQVLEELIYDLQIRYVNATRRSGSPPPAPPRS
jgi:hypothetical protein